MIAYAMGVAYLQTLRCFNQTVLEAYAFVFHTAAGTQVAGWRRGRHLDFVGFASAAASVYGVTFDGNSVAHKGWGLCTEAGPGRLAEASIWLR